MKKNGMAAAMVKREDEKQKLGVGNESGRRARGQ